MAKTVRWTKKLLEDFYEHALLNDDEQYIMESRIKGVPVSLQADHLCCSESTVHRMISNIKKKYDLVQKEYPEKFPPRRNSKEEAWMDKN